MRYPSMEESTAPREPTGAVSLSGGGVTSPLGFLAGAARAAVRESPPDKLDLGLLYSLEPCTAAALFTANTVRAAPILVSERHLAGGRARAAIVNSGCANASTGERGLADAGEMARLAAEKLSLGPQEAVVASTGVIGWFLPMDRIRSALAGLRPTREGGLDFARAIMTTDTVPKSVVASMSYDGSAETSASSVEPLAEVGRRYLMGGCAKGSGMIHPQVATMLVFLTTDAPVQADFLRESLRQAADASFNMMTIDGDTSPNDMVLALANGAASGPGDEAIGPGHRAAPLFQAALTQVCTHLARELARDGEGASKLIEVRVEGAADEADARRVARAVAGSLLVKTAVHGCDPNWGRVLTAAGYSGARVREDTCCLYLQGVRVFARGLPEPFDEAALRQALAASEVTIRVDLGLGSGAATAWGCDLTPDYVRINAQYTT
jgi:glutamate N-acetyltransferase/amino-acid N-acetyltransferase